MLSGSVLADGVGERMSQDLAQPAFGLGFALPVKSAVDLRLVGLQECLLNEVRRVEFRLQPAIKLETSQQMKVSRYWDWPPVTASWAITALYSY